jgi:hypothetical protein
VVRVLSGLAVLFCLMLPAQVAAQDHGRMTVEIGGQTHVFAVSGTWEDFVDGGVQLRQITIWAEHPDGTTISLAFTQSDGRIGNLLFRFREPATAQVVVREWSEGRGFRVTLSGMRAAGDAVMVSGRFRGALVDVAVPGARGRIDGRFEITLLEPVYSPS